MILKTKTSVGEYNIVISRGVLNDLKEYLNLDRKVLVVTDSGVPENYAKAVAAQCKEGHIYTFLQGEESKNFDTYQAILTQLVKNGFTRSDCVVAVGGGVTGDMAGFAAASYMRGIDFYNIPTTVLSQVDSSIGGKVAIDYCGVKNIVGAFYPPKAVIIDADTLKTLPQRQVNNGLCEALKMAATFDSEFFSHFENDELNIDYIIEQSLRLKRQVVEEDEKEQGVRKVLNFGHTIGHAIESVNLGSLYHGECVGLGMLYLCSDEVKPRIMKALKRLNLPTSCEIDADKIIDFMSHDKKKAGDSISVIWVEEIGSYEIKKMNLDELKEVILK
ncbi:MAG: 3-dehydroquinate synthase [Ruminococcaceae bacterium]|nr:3-dehydroquinate synthase [Oscillospiraceae bacterium]